MALNAITGAAAGLLEGVQSAIGVPPSHAKSTHKEIRIQQLFVHPIKSCRGSSVPEAAFDEGGLRYDRSWLIIDAKSKKFQTARDLPQMVTIIPTMDLTNNILSIEVPLHEKGKGKTVVKTPLDPSDEELRNMELVQDINIWVHKVDGYAVSKEADAALTQFFGKAVRLVRKGPTVRPSGPDDPRGDSSAMHYQDFYPLLIASRASLQHVRDTLVASVYSSMTDKNGKMPLVEAEEAHETSQASISGDKDKKTESSPSNYNDGMVTSYKVPDTVRRDYWTPEQLETLEIRRFRPNVIVESFNDNNDPEKVLDPWEEDSWTHIEAFDGRKEASGELQIGWGKDAIGKGTGIDCVARCARCLVPSIDPSSGYRDPHLPYLVLQKFRIVQPEFKSIGKPCFGMLSSPSQPSGTLRVGDIIRVTTTMDPSKRTMKKPGE
ncbi:hypothetical protein CBS101457_000718 [Exobasidium rhododendri]|nr:hypothetical protein CBS101457_000718 [Exobasidium rhododendri]